MFVVDLVMAMSWTKASDPQRKWQCFPQGRLEEMARPFFLMWMLAVCVQKMPTIAFSPWCLQPEDCSLHRLLLLRLTKPTSWFSHMQQPCIPAQLYIINMMSFQCSVALPSESPVHLIPDLPRILVFVFFSLPPCPSQCPRIQATLECSHAFTDILCLWYLKSRCLPRYLGLVFRWPFMSPNHCGQCDPIPLSHWCSYVNVSAET